MPTRALERRPVRRMPIFLSPFWTSPVNRFFRDDFFNGDLLMETIPSLNISEEKNEYIVELAAPGLKRDDFNISLEGDVLTISCDKESQKKESEGELYRKEFDFSSFSRSISLPDFSDTKEIDAKYENGILRIIILKKPEAQKLTQKIKVE